MHCEIRIDFGTIAAIFFALTLFGVGYNALIAWMEHKGYTEGFLSLIVAFGVAVTLGGVGILSIQAALLALGAFVATGTPMIVGSIARYIKAREEAKRAMLDEVKHDKA